MRSHFEVVADYFLRDNFPELAAETRDRISESLTQRLMVEFDKDGQAHRWPAHDELGNPHCSYCGAMGFNDGTEKPMRTDHPQYGVFCTCTEPLAAS
jgi:hypothetical protein